MDSEIAVRKLPYENNMKEQGSEIPSGSDFGKTNTEPFIYCRFICDYPVRAFLLALGGHILMVVTSGILVATGYELLPLYFDNLPMEIHSVPWHTRDLAWRSKDTYDNRYERLINHPNGGNWDRSSSYALGNIVLYYETNGNVFTKQNLENIKKVEDGVLGISNFNQYCQIGFDSSCSKPLSILRYFDGTYSFIDPVFNDTSFDNIATVLYTAYTNNETKGIFQYFLAKSHSITTTKASAATTRSVIFIGKQESLTEQDLKEKLRLYSGTTIKPVLEHYVSSISSFELVYFSNMLFFYDVLNQAMSDMMLAIGSVGFIFLFMLIHTRSLWITSFGVMSILTSFIGTNLIYRLVFDFRYIGFFHVLSIFIILGIGADDLFVFYDTWRNSATRKYPTLAHRLNDVYRKSVLSMLITSLTTMVAFFASGLSPLLATSSFGIFSGTLIMVNYISVIVFFPTVVVLYHVKFESFTWPCCRCCKQKSSVSPDKSNTTRVFKINVQPLTDIDSVLPPDKSPATKGNQVERKTKFIPPESIVRNDSGLTRTETSDTEKKSTLVLFFQDKYFRFVTHKVARWILLCIFASVITFFAYSASRLEPDNEDMKVYPSDHNYGRARTHALYTFMESESDALVQVYIVWGLKPHDRSSCHFSDPECQGVPVFDENFNPNSPEAQIALKNYCDKLKSLPASKANELRIKKNINNDLEVACFTLNMEPFLQAHSSDVGIDMGLTWNYTKVMDMMQAKPEYYNTTGFDSGFQHHLEIPISYWLYDGYSMNYTNDYFAFSDLIGEETCSYSTVLKTSSNVKYGNKIKYIGIKVNTTMNGFSLGYVEGLPILDNWENFVSSEVNKMPEGLRGGFQLTRRIWHWLTVQKSLADNAIFGIALGVSLAFPILTLATQNVIIGLLATLSISCTTVCVIGVIPLAGWKLGVLESLNMCLLVGLSVDYVVHLAEGYHLSQHSDRLSRTQDMLEDMAVPIFSGACTTLGASLFMFFSVVLFFMQFGIFMFCTIGFSLFFSLGMFTTLMGLVGPENEFGSIAHIYRPCLNSSWCQRNCRRTNTVNND